MIPTVSEPADWFLGRLEVARNAVVIENLKKIEHGSITEIFYQLIRYKYVSDFIIHAIKVFSEKLDFDAEPKINTINENYKKQGGNVKIFSEPINFEADSKVDALNPNYKKTGGNVKVYGKKKIIF
jgi:hypothetical protein